MSDENFIFVKYGFGIWHIFKENNSYLTSFTLCNDRPVDDTYKTRWEFSVSLDSLTNICPICFETHKQFCHLVKCEGCHRIFIMGSDPQTPFVCNDICAEKFIKDYP